MGEEIIIDERDFMFLELGHELWALGAHLDVLEHQILSWQQRNLGQSPSPLTEDSVECEASPADTDELYEYLEDFEKSVEYHDLLADAEMQEHLDTVDYVLPRLLRSSFIVVLWAVYEAAVKELAEYMRGQGHLKMSDLGGDFTKQSRRYFRHILGTPLYSNEEVCERLGRPEVIRHAIAHANGRLTELRPNIQEQLNRWIREDRGISTKRGCLMLSEAFVRQGYADVNCEIERLIAIAKSKGAGSKSVNKPSDNAPG